MNYIIYAPEYRQNSGGIVVLHTLGSRLAQLGHIVFMLSEKSIDGLPCIDFNTARKLKDDCWVIYPEIVIGNPVGGKNVIRWVLNTPGYIGGDSNTWSDTDLVYRLWDYFHIDPSIKPEGYLRMFDFKLDLFRDMGQARTINTHLFRKSIGKKQSPTDIVFDKHSADSICIDGEIADNFKLLVETLNKTKIFISYDTATYYSIIAALCGAISVVVPYGSYTKDEFHKLRPATKYGVAYGFDEIQWAIDTKHKVREHLESMESECNVLLDEFIINTTNKFIK